MSFSKEEFKEAGIEIEDILSANTAVEWLNDNTKLKIDLEDVKALKDIPNAAKLFIVKFAVINSTEQNSLVTSESIAGMSQSFRTDSSNTLVWELANQLLSKYLKSNLKVMPNESKWY